MILASISAFDLLPRPSVFACVDASLWISDGVMEYHHSVLMFNSIISLVQARS